MEVWSKRVQVVIQMWKVRLTSVFVVDPGLSEKVNDDWPNLNSKAVQHSQTRVS
jgi:hypothetical protein